MTSIFLSDDAGTGGHTNTSMVFVKDDPSRTPAHVHITPTGIVHQLENMGFSDVDDDLVIILDFFP